MIKIQITQNASWDIIKPFLPDNIKKEVKVMKGPSKHNKLKFIKDILSDAISKESFIIRQLTLEFGPITQWHAQYAIPGDEIALNIKVFVNGKER